MPEFFLQYDLYFNTPNGKRNNFGLSRVGGNDFEDAKVKLLLKQTSALSEENIEFEYLADKSSIEDESWRWGALKMNMC